MQDFAIKKQGGFIFFLFDVDTGRGLACFRKESSLKLLYLLIFSIWFLKFSLFIVG